MTEPLGCSLDDDGGSMWVRVARVEVIDQRWRSLQQHD
jgi:hypothetical protein